MKIVIATESYWPLIDGGAVAEHHLALGLAQRGHEVHVLAPSESFRRWTQSDTGTTIHRFPSFPIPFVKNDHRLALGCRASVYEVLDRIQPDVCHIHNPFPLGKATLAFAQSRKVPVVATNHWLPENLTTFMARFRFVNQLQWIVDANWRFIRDFHNQCQFVTSPTQTAIELMTQNGLVAPHRPVSNGVDLSVFNPQNDPTALKQRLRLPNKPTMLYAGRLSGEKHVDVAVKALALILKQHDIHFIIGGNGREKEPLMALARQLGVADHVTMPGFLDDDEYRCLFRCADWFVMPSICELQSITTLEAMASGLPVVGANRYALPELIHPGVNGALFEPGNDQALASQVMAMLSSDRLQAMGQESLRLVAAHSLDRAISDYESIYHQLTQR